MHRTFLERTITFFPSFICQKRRKKNEEDVRLLRRPYSRQTTILLLNSCLRSLLGSQVSLTNLFRSIDQRSRAKRSSRLKRKGSPPGKIISRLRLPWTSLASWIQREVTLFDRRFIRKDYRGSSSRSIVKHQLEILLEMISMHSQLMR